MSKLCEFRGLRLAAFAFGTLAFLTLAAGASAQTAGKVEGTVTDRDTGQPLPGAQVVIQGTQLGNIADDSGYYFVNNVPLGSQTVTATFLGYQTEAKEHRILSGQTTTVDFALSTEVIVADSAIITVTEREPLVPRDNTISKSRFIKENVQDLPITSVENLVTLAAGASEQQGGISLRGARPDDATVYVDGLNATDYANVSDAGVSVDEAGGERSPLEFGQFSIEQLDVVTGGADASYGDAQSGVINIVTGRGGGAFSGSVRFNTDAMGIERTDDFYALQGNVGGPLLSEGRGSFFLSGTVGGQRLTNDRFGFDPTFEDVVGVGARYGIDIRENADGRTEFCEAASCEDLPPEQRIVARRAGDIVEGNTVATDLPLLRIDNFVREYLEANCGEGKGCPANFLQDNEFYFDAGDSDLLPGRFSNRYAFSGKLAFTPTQSTDIQLSYNRSRDQGNLDVGNFNPFNDRLFKETVDFAVGSVRQVFYQEADRSLAIDARLGYFDDQYRAGAPFNPLDSLGGFPLLEGNRDGDDFLNFRFSDYEFFFEDVVDQVLENYSGSNAWRDVEGSCPAPLAHGSTLEQAAARALSAECSGLRQPLDLGAAYFVPPTTLGGGPDIFGFGLSNVQSNLFPLPTVGFPRGDMRGAIAEVRNNREKRWNFRADADAQISRIDRLQGGVDLKFFDVRRFSLRLHNKLFNTQYFVEPRLFGFYATNRIDLGDFVLDLGGRVDRYDHNTLLPEVPGVARIDLDGNCGDVPETDLRFGSAECTLTEYDTKTAFAPRLGVAHPVTEKTQVRFSYGVFNQLPGMDELYLNITGDINANDLNSNALVGNPDLDFQQTKSFELGITHLVSEDVVLDLVAYNRDIDKGTASRFFVPPQSDQVKKIFNVNNGNVRGFDLTLTKRFADYWSADATYSYLDSKVTDSDQDQFTFNRGFDFSTDNPVAAPAVALPADYDVTHKLALTGSLRFPADFGENTTLGALFQNFGVFGTARFASGLPYTRQPVLGGVFFAPPNSSRRDSEFQADLRATKYFPLAADVELGAIFEVFNVFNNDNPTQFQADPFLGLGINNGVYNSTGNRLLEGREIQRSQQLTGEDVILETIPNQDTPAGQLTREFREFSDIDGDGTVSTQEQRIMSTLALGASTEITGQPKRNYRLGVELRF